jgi:hypothetical protein
MLRSTDVVVAVIAIAFLLMGVGAFANPMLVTKQFGIAALDADGRNEVRAVYGGFGLAMSGILLGALVCEPLRRGACSTVACALGGMAFGRLVSWAMDRKLGRWPRVYVVIEAAGAAALMASALR